MKLRKFQVIYQEKRALTIGEAKAFSAAISGDGTGPAGDVKIVCLEAEHEADVRRIFEGFHVRDILDRGVVIDPNQSVYDREEAAEYLRVSPSHIDTLMKTNVLPKSQKGFPMFHRSHLDKVWSTRMAFDDEKPQIKRAA